MKNDDCSYCKESLIVPLISAGRLVDKHIKKFNESKDLKSFEKLKMFAKMSYGAEYYILCNFNNIYQQLETYASKIPNDASYFLRRIFLNEKKDTKTYCLTCNFCLREACDFHAYYGGFSFERCNLCSSRYSICGWCNESIKDEFKNKCPICIQRENSDKKQIKNNQDINLKDINDLKIYVNNDNTLMKRDIFKINDTNIDVNLILNTVSDILN